MIDILTRLKWLSCALLTLNLVWRFWSCFVWFAVFHWHEQSKILSRKVINFSLTRLYAFCLNKEGIVEFTYSSTRRIRQKYERLALHMSPYHNSVLFHCFHFNLPLSFLVPRICRVHPLFEQRGYCIHSFINNMVVLPCICLLITTLSCLIAFTFIFSCPTSMSGASIVWIKRVL